MKHVLAECNDNCSSGHFSADKTLDKVKKTAWWVNWRDSTIQYVTSCETCQKSNRTTGKRFGLLQKISEPKKRWEIINMDFSTVLPPGGAYPYKSVLVIVDRFSKKAKFLPNHKEDTAMEVSLLFWNRLIADV